MADLKQKVLLVRSDSFNPWRNLALENLLTDAVAEEDQSASATRTKAILYLWQNDHTVVIGRNQNAWAECFTGLLESENGKLARRSTGGGAVYHDLGNLNFSLIMPRGNYSIDNNFQLILQAVLSLGISAEKSGRNDLLADGRKFSGNAFSQKKGVGLHHGTLLVNSDYGRLARYLNVAPDKFKGKGVSSVRSRVINLQEIEPALTVDKVSQAMENTFLDIYGSQEKETAIVERLVGFAAFDQARLAELESFYASWDWRFGQTLKFDTSVSQRFDWGKIEIGFVIDKGLVEQAVIYSDALDSDFLDQITSLLQGTRFHSSDLVKAISAASFKDPGYGPGRETMATDIAALILDRNW